MNILNIAIEAAGSVGALAEELGVTSQCVSNWKRLGRVPHMPSRAIKSIYAKQISKAEKEEKQAAKEQAKTV